MPPVSQPLSWPKSQPVVLRTDGIKELVSVNLWRMAPGFKESLVDHVTCRISTAAMSALRKVINCHPGRVHRNCFGGGFRDV
jgi:hypothetical protein